jgi:hypothetical protein
VIASFLAKYEVSGSQLYRIPPVKLSITHICGCPELGAQFDIGQSRKPAPANNISGRRIACPGQVAAQSGCPPSASIRQLEANLKGGF